MKKNNKKIKNILIGISIPIIILIIVTLSFCNQKIKQEEQEAIAINNQIASIINTSNGIIIEEARKKENAKIIIYTTTRVNIRNKAGLDGNIIKTVPINTELTKVGEDGEWSEILVDQDIKYIKTSYISTEKTQITKIETKPKEVKVATTRGGTVNQRTQNSNSKLTKSKGVNYFNGHKETYYSQKVLPGGGLKIPGRHVASDGTIRDGDNYICVASSDYKKGTIVETSLGTGKVYDCGCANGTIDIYTNW